MMGRQDRDQAAVILWVQTR